MLSRKFQEWRGNRQGHVRADGHYKAYINPCLDAVNSAGLGCYIGPINLGTTCCADDTYLQAYSPRSLQSALHIVSHYANRYRVVFNPSKTKIVVTGSKHDMSFYADTKPWKLNGQEISVVENNDHLGLIVSGMDEELKNVDNNINKCRRSLFSLLGPAFSYNCQLSPATQIHLWHTYNLPVLLSGLAALPVRPTQIAALATFHHKILRGFLHLSSTAPVPSLYFLLGEVPIEAKVHLDLLALFYNIWSNPSTKIHHLIKYLLMMTDTNSTTWANHVRIIFSIYSLPDPLSLLQQHAWTKSQWKEVTNTHIIVHMEKKWRGI